MGLEPASWALIGTTAASVIGGAATALATTPTPTDTTNYELLKQTQAAADAESEAAKARIEEARKWEELRQQQMYAQDVLTSDTGVEDLELSVKDQILGRPE